MNDLESQLTYPLGEILPSSGATIEVAPGVLWLRMELPFALNHINLWLLEDWVKTDVGSVHGWTVVDCGVANDATRATWEVIFATQLRGLPIVRIIATHCHPDHLGLADWLCERWNARLWMSTGEYAFGRLMSAALPGADGSAAFPHFQQHGLREPEMLAQLEGRRNFYPMLVPSVPKAYCRIFDGQLLNIGNNAWRAITGFGHSPEHVSLYCDALQLLISGDMVLPRISTNVSVVAIEPEANPLQLYLNSLAKLANLPTATLVLPSHGKPFIGLPIRIEQLQSHHEARLAEVIDACRTPKSAADIVPIMFKRSLDSHQLSFALGEALAHLNKLWVDGQLQRRTDQDGIIQFCAIN